MQESSWPASRPLGECISARYQIYLAASFLSSPFVPINRLIVLHQIKLMDSLSVLFKHFTMNAKVFYSGTLCGIVDFDNSQGGGILHVLRQGTVRVNRPPLLDLELTKPTLLFCRRPFSHRFEVDHRDGADLVCASIDFGVALNSPTLRGLPDFLCVPLENIPGIANIIASLFNEAFADRPGRAVAIDRLMEFMVVLLFRHAIDEKLIELGTIAGLSDVKLAKAILAMHEKPEYPWTLEELAQTATMSRTRFAATFKEIVGIPPLDYLTDWRISYAQKLLKSGKPVKLVAPAVGYSSTTAFSRAFDKHIGMTPFSWITMMT
ncbi:AraC family transcriptional regulator [Undibacterium sp. SXout20W]|uniref:helix-turn-helix transcriptional regulator n=1 Tax=Undibacterium sp. SXout20W TaxID=3413051 RepID=UPI003BF2E301